MSYIVTRHFSHHMSYTNSDLFFSLEGDPEGWKSVMDTNVLGCLYCSRQVLGQLKELGWEGQIIHINSISGYYKFAGVAPDGFINAYSPSKNALTCINDILRHEMNFYKMPVKITVRR